MKNKLILALFLSSMINFANGQNKKELIETIDKLRVDSTNLEIRLEEKTLMIEKIKQKSITCEELNLKLQNQNDDLLMTTKQFKDSLNITLAQNTLMNDSLNKLNLKSDSIQKYYPVKLFVETFYKSLELSKEENQRQYEVGNVSFSLDNFHSLIDKNSNYSKKRVNNLSDPSYHDRYYIELQNIEEIKITSDEILVKTRVLYESYGMGAFYNEELLTLKINRGLIKLYKWSDLRVYKMELSEYEGMENFSESDFYQWMGSINK